MKTFQQVRDILKHVQKMRSRMRQLTEECLENTQDELLSAYLERATVHDDYMRLCLAGEADEAPPAALNTWIQYPDLQPLDEEMDPMVDENLDDSQKVLDRLVAVDKQILDIYDRVREQSESQAVRDLFDRLYLMEEQKARAKGWGQAEMRDL